LRIAARALHHLRGRIRSTGVTARSGYSRSLRAVIWRSGRSRTPTPDKDKNISRRLPASFPR
jgi:hypothetical protein